MRILAEEQCLRERLDAVWWIVVFKDDDLPIFQNGPKYRPEGNDLNGSPAQCRRADEVFEWIAMSLIGTFATSCDVRSSVAIG
jgi:hypothetical protein